MFPPVLAQTLPLWVQMVPEGPGLWVYINAPTAKQIELMMNAASTPYAETTNPPILAPKQRAALQVALLSALAVSNSFSGSDVGN